MKIKQTLVNKQFKTYTKYFNSWGPVTFDISKVDPSDYEAWYAAGFQELFDVSVPPVPQDPDFPERIKYLEAQRDKLLDQLAFSKALLEAERLKQAYIVSCKPLAQPHARTQMACQPQIACNMSSQTGRSTTGFTGGRINIAQDGTLYMTSATHYR